MINKERISYCKVETAFQGKQAVPGQTDNTTLHFYRLPILPHIIIISLLLYYLGLVYRKGWVLDNFTKHVYCFTNYFDLQFSMFHEFSVRLVEALKKL